MSDESVQLLDIHLFITDDVGRDELTAVLIVESLHGDVLNTRVLADNGFHFLHFDAETTDFHLTVLTTDKLNIAIGEVTYDITSAIHTTMLRVVAERILYVSLCSLFRTVQVATAHLRSSDPQLAHGTNWQSIELLVNNIKFQIV